jgi:hypothetical protein
MTKVISLRGDPLPGSPAPNEVLVEMLTDLLAEAQAGQLIGVAMCGHYREGSLNAMWAHHEGQADRLSTGVMLLQREFMEAWVE